MKCRSMIVDFSMGIGGFLTLFLSFYQMNSDKVNIGLDNMKCRSMIVDFFMGIGGFLNLFLSFYH